jgi:hypothetical protein
MAEVSILMEVRFIEVDEKVSAALGLGQPTLQLRDEGLPPRRVGPAEQLLGLLPAQAPAAQRGADGLAAAGPAAPRAHPGDQPPERPAGCGVGAGYGRGGGGALRLADDLAEAGLGAGTKGGRPPVRRWIRASGPWAL